MASYSVNKAAVAHARRLIDGRQYVLRSDWGDRQPDAEAENRYLDLARLGGLRRLAPRSHRGRDRRDEGTLRLRLRRPAAGAPLRADRVRVPGGGVASQGDRARRARAPPAPRRQERLTTVARGRGRGEPDRSRPSLDPPSRATATTLSPCRFARRQRAVREGRASTLARMILLVAATERELCGHDGLVCGVGPVEAAVATARALALHEVSAVVHVGLAGARGLEPGSLVVGTEAVYLDLSAEWPVVDRVEADAALLAARSGRSARRPVTADPHLGRRRRRCYEPRATSARRGDGGLRRPPGGGSRRACPPSRCGRSRTRSASPTGRAGTSTAGLAALERALPALVAALTAA